MNARMIMDVYLGKNRPCVTTDMTATFMNDRLFTKQMEGFGINCIWTLGFPHHMMCSAVWQRCKLITMKQSTEKGDILSRTKDNLIAIVWSDEQNVHIWTDMHHPATNYNLFDECVVSAKPAVMEDYNRHRLCWLRQQDVKWLPGTAPEMPPPISFPRHVWIATSSWQHVGLQ